MNQLIETTEPKKIVKKWIKKDGTISQKEYDQKKYSAKHYEKNKVAILAKTSCSCGIEYSPHNKHNHFKTRIHKLWDTYKDRLIKEIEPI